MFESSQRGGSLDYAAFHFAALDALLRRREPHVGLYAPSRVQAVQQRCETRPGCLGVPLPRRARGVGTNAAFEWIFAASCDDHSVGIDRAARGLAPK